MFGPRLVQRIRPTIRSGELPLSFEQLNKVMEPVGADSTHHNVVAAVVLTPRDDAPDEQLNVDALQRALDRIRDRHEILRTSLQANGGDGHPEDWFQTVQASTPWPLTVMDLRGQPLSAAHEVVRELEETPLPVAEGTPMRTVVAALDDRKWLLVQGFHHAFVDPWGFSQFLSELTTLYNQERSGERKDLAPLPIQYGDLAAWQHHQVEAGPGREQQRYWLELFEDLPPRPIYQRLHPTTRPLASATAGFRLSEDLTERLRQAARSNGVSLFILLLASFQALQLVSTRSDDVLVTVPLMGRDEPETHQLIGYLINEVTVRTKAGHETTFAELLALVRDGLLAGQDHQVVPLRALAKTDESRWDPMRTMFNLVDFGSVQATLGGFRGQALPPEGEESLIPELAGEPSPDNLDLYLVLHQRGDELRGLWMFSNDSVDASAMADMVEQWPRLLELTTAHADITLKGLRVALSGRPAASTLEEEL
ncbi:MAG: hypothetical protein GX596_00690 [Propionibacterium sp.]|nr:hypothetical protein [Propionibacterium sp.]